MPARPTTFAACAAAALASCALLAALAVAADDDAYPTGDPAIPPGEEAVIGAMLGKGLALASCTLVTGGADHTMINATYACPGGGVTVRLDHPRNAAARATITEQFAIAIAGGSPPPGFADALASLVRLHEPGFQWASQDDRFPDDDTDDDAAD